MPQKNNSFQEQVWEIIRLIPKGKITTYREIAGALKNQRACRAVGSACRRNKKIPLIPCHRVVQSNGFAGAYAHGQKKKEALLRAEGIKIINHKIVDFNAKRVKANELCQLKNRSIFG